jgi:triphosphatase
MQFPIRSSGLREIEIKFEIDAGRLVELRGSSVLRAVSASTKRLVSTYFDADDLPLCKARLSWRVRQVGQRFTQTVKDEGSGAAGLHDRSEWEVEIEDGQPDIDVMAETSFAYRVNLESLRGRLKPQFRTDIERTIWRIRQGSSVVEVACDKGRVIAGDSSSDIAELELELVDGTIADLFALARDLAATCRGRIGVTSKADRGYALIAHQPAQAVKTSPLPITSDMTAGEAFKIVLRACIRHFRQNEPLVETSRDVEALHQARVALRRVRAAFSIFGPLVGKEELARLKARLKRLFRKLGRARNMDVCIAKLPREATEEPASLELIQKVTRRRERA